MNKVTIDTRQPVVFAFDPVGGMLAEMKADLICGDFRLCDAKTPPDLEAANLQDYRKLGAILLDGSSPSFTVQDCMQHVDLGYRDAGGPIIALVDDFDKTDEKELLDLGVTKVVEAGLGFKALRTIISIEIEDFSRLLYLRTELRKRSSAIGQIVKGQFRFKTRREAQNLATLLSMTCPNPMPIAIGLTELFVNGVEHGCLDIGHEEKGQLIEDGMLAEEIERRRGLPEYKDLFVTVDFEREANRVFFEITDSGNGFDFASYMEETGSHNKKHGRGIMMAKSCFEKLEYQGSGNQVQAVHYFGIDIPN
ncbi:MAG: ATP-binding protein [Kordiimonadaceae bacterium]|nr:ATP-binding protein [Kordiimonadaceae bacterium]